jgi:hypothetical protein
MPIILAHSILIQLVINACNTADEQPVHTHDPKNNVAVKGEVNPRSCFSEDAPGY